jgi:hypothetical protein
MIEDRKCLAQCWLFLAIEGGLLWGLSVFVGNVMPAEELYSNWSYPDFADAVFRVCRSIARYWYLGSIWPAILLVAGVRLRNKSADVILLLHSVTVFTLFLFACALILAYATVFTEYP